jgi:hypothetical protein
MLKSIAMIEAPSFLGSGTITADEALFDRPFEKSK